MKKKNYSIEIANAITAFLTGDDWKFSFDEETGLFKFGLGLSGKIKKLNYIIDVKQNEYLVYAFSAIGADEKDDNMMATMSEFICRSNYGLKNGGFEFDMRDGEIRFKCYVDCEGAIPSKEIIKNSISCPAVMFKRYAEGIADIVFGNATAKDAFEKCERAANAEIRTLLNALIESAVTEGASTELTEPTDAPEEDNFSDPDGDTSTDITDLLDSEEDDEC